MRKLQLVLTQCLRNRSPLMLLVFFLHLLPIVYAMTAATIDLTTEFALVGKPTSVGSGRSGTKISVQSSTSSNPPKVVIKPLANGHNVKHKESINGDQHNNRRPAPVGGNSVIRPKQSSVPLTPKSKSKSYITAPTIAGGPQVKVAKRQGVPEHKTKKIYKEYKNRTNTKEPEGRNKLYSDVSDPIPDSSGHIPYRIGRPALETQDYGSAGISSSGATGSGSVTGAATGAVTGDSGYNTPPYEQEKWQNEYWDRDYNKIHGFNTTRVQHIEAECQDDYMKIRIGFNGSFSGLLYSAGYAYDPDCMYINGSGRDYYEFYIQLNRCGTLGKNALHDESHKNPTNFMWNTVTVQYNPLIEEEYDEHFKVTCEYGYDFWKTVTFPFLDVEVATGNPVVFTLSPPECYMEIQNGYGIGGARVTGPVRVGDPLTLIIYMRSKYDGFDIVVNDCYAHNGANKRIQLIDEFGCPVDDKLISRFRGSWSDSGVFETQVYAYMKTFRFTGSPALYIECDVRMCHGRCPSQPCHWRNLKAVTKRDVSNISVAAISDSSSLLEELGMVTEKLELPLSENINLFQSLRVLQEGETDSDDIYSNARRADNEPSHQTCLKTATFSAMTATFTIMLCLLSGALMIACSRLKQRSKEGRSLYDTYITHKDNGDDEKHVRRV